MAGEIIRQGDPTSHGGKVIEGSASDICHGKPIAFIGHKVTCPKCKGVFPIVEGVPTTTFYGKGVAIAGMKTACGASLIATQFSDIVKIGGGNSATKKSAAATSSGKPEQTLLLQKRLLRRRIARPHLCLRSKKNIPIPLSMKPVVW